MPLPIPRQIALFAALSIVSCLYPQQQILADNTHPSSDSDLLALASSHSSSDLHHLSLGDGHYVLDAPRSGYIYLCHIPRQNEGGASGEGPWIHGATWNPEEKLFVSGDRTWSDAVFTMDRAQGNRLFTGNGLPISHTTGSFPIQSSDSAFRYDKNPNSIQPQSFNESVSLTPSYTDPPYCMGMEVGVMLTGVPLFNGFDAGLRDAAAHEIQDKCNGHPQKNGQYHYHNLSACIKNADIHAVIGYALDGFPITGGEVAVGKILMTSDLDVCHGVTSEIVIDGKRTTSYHYVMTPDFPYSVSCFRSHPARTDPSGGQMSGRQDMGGPPGGGRHPPMEALAACDGNVSNSSCSFITPRGDRIDGSCLMVSDDSLACVPQR